MDPPELSILLPTYNRVDALQCTLAALESQPLPKASFEIIIVDDGSTDQTPEKLHEFAKASSIGLSYAILKKNGGPARARNIGLEMCRGEIILIIGDDIEPCSDLLGQHLKFHRQNPDKKYALLGKVVFPDALRPNAFMRWLEKGGQRYFFNYDTLEPHQQADAMFFYTCNVSVKSSLLAKSGWFDESFPYASHEDLELGCRLGNVGMKLVYAPHALGYHWHMLSVGGIARRVYLMGYSAHLFWRRIEEQGAYAKRVAR